MFSRIVRRARYLFRRSTVEREMDVEMRLHLEMEIEDRIKHGMTAAEARRSALADFGGVERFKEEGRDARGVRAVDELVQDLRYTTRVLRANPGFTAATVLTLGLGIAATTVVVSAVNALLFEPLPVRDPDELFVIRERWSNTLSNSHVAGWIYPYPHYLEFAEATGDVFTDVAAHRYDMFSLRAGDGAKILSGIIASGNYFQTLGLSPALGRFFSHGAAGPGSAELHVVIGHEFWQTELAGDSSVLGQTLFIDSRPLSIVGVAPNGFRGTIAGLVADVWIPAAVFRQPPPRAADAETLAAREPPWLTMFGRLSPEISSTQALAVLQVIGSNLEPHDPGVTIDRIELDPMRSVPTMMRAATMGFAGMLSITAGLVLLIAAINVAGMLLARAIHRRREIAVRLALGASRARVVRQLVTETLTLGLLGATVGIVLAAWLIGLPPALRVPVVGSVDFNLHLDPVVLAASIGVALGAGLFTGLTPARRATRLDLASGLRSVAAGPPKTQARVRTAFVIGQLAMSLMLLITAGLFVRALQHGLTIDPGLDATGVGVAGINLAPHGYDGARSRVFFDALVDRLAARPEIAAVGLGGFTPFSGSYAGLGMVPEGAGPDAQLVRVEWGIASPGYFESTRVPIVAGRAFTDADAPGRPPVAIVNETLARRFWPGESPLGERIVFLGDPRSVVGVSRDGKVRGFSEEQLAYVYLPYRQRTSRSMLVYARGRVGAAAALSAVRDEVAALDGNVALESAVPLAEQISLPLLPQRAAAWLVGVFGGIGLVLTAFGVYGIIAYHVAARTREFGIRLALGARGGMLIRDVLRYAVVIVGVGTVFGVVASMGTARLVAGFLFGISATDPITFVTVPLTLAGVAIAASYIPARRAAKVDPVTSLRAE